MRYGGKQQWAIFFRETVDGSVAACIMRTSSLHIAAPHVKQVLDAEGDL
jgi:hypothetical protein